MNVPRVLKHLFLPDWITVRGFSASLLEEIETAVQESERLHHAELRFVAEGSLDLMPVLRGQTARERALELFSALRVWDTAQNSGVLIYVQMVDRRIEIVADRGIAARVPQRQWDDICRTMERAFPEGRYREGALGAIAQITTLLGVHFPVSGENPNELPNKPLVL